MGTLPATFIAALSLKSWVKAHGEGFLIQRKDATSVGISNKRQRHHVSTEMSDRTK